MTQARMLPEQEPVPFLPMFRLPGTCSVTPVSSISPDSLQDWATKLWSLASCRSGICKVLTSAEIPADYNVRCGSGHDSGKTLCRIAENILPARHNSRNSPTCWHASIVSSRPQESSIQSCALAFTSLRTFFKLGITCTGVPTCLNKKSSSFAGPWMVAGVCDRLHVTARGGEKWGHGLNPSRLETKS